jgi:hypothetical protein
VVIVSGIVKVVTADVNEKAGGRDNKNNSLYLIYIDANCIDK